MSRAVCQCIFTQVVNVAADFTSVVGMDKSLRNDDGRKVRRYIHKEGKIC
ncbi:MAG TPA: hypothetical protein VN729_03030 [Ktedonobacteraceae bacterium]|nr:hypothetical protein [Ktedonobacteraceae bacterium]